MMLSICKKIKKGNLSAEEHIGKYMGTIKKSNKKINAVLHINEGAIEEARKIDGKIKKGAAGKLAGLGFIVKSNIVVEGMICNCASKTLANYVGVYTATVVQRLLDEDAILLGMANMDEFACGSSGETSAFGVCQNPSAFGKIPGGSSSGSAACVAADFCDFSLGSDTGGSIRNPASHCGVVGFKPSYGAVSRYGLIDLSMSLDQIGPLCKSVADCRSVFEVIRGKDVHDPTSIDVDDHDQASKKHIVIGVPKITADERIWKLIRDKISNVATRFGWKVIDFLLPHADLGVQTYYPINYVEFFSGTRKFDGRTYGKNINEVAGEEVIRRIVGGKMISKAEFADQYYLKALAAKQVISKEFEKAFSKVDLIIMPVVPKLPHALGKKLTLEESYDYDRLSVLANLAEIPALSIPCGTLDGIPVGMQLLAKKGNDSLLLELSKHFE